MIPAVLEAAVRATGLGPGSPIIEQRSETPHRTNRLYDVWADGRHPIAKEYLSNVDLDAPLNEYRALRLVESMDIASRPLFFDPSVGPVVVYAYMDGAMCNAAQVCMQSLERGLADALPLIPEVAPVCFCRSDARFANVISRPDGRVGLVDWEDSGLRDPAHRNRPVEHHGSRPTPGSRASGRFGRALDRHTDRALRWAHPVAGPGRQPLGQVLSTDRGAQSPGI